MKSMQGMSLWEALFSLMILSYLLLSIFTFENMLVRQARSSMFANIAWQQIEGLADLLIFLNEDNLQKVLLSWNTINQKILPNGKGKLLRQNRLYKITLQWGNYNSDCTHNKIDISGCMKLDVIL